MDEKRNLRNFTPQEKVILRKHLVDKVPVSDVREEYQLQSTIFYQWLKKFFENGASASRRRRRYRMATTANRGVGKETPGDFAL